MKGKVFSIKGIRGTLKEIRNDNLVMTTSGVEFARPVSDLSTGELAEIGSKSVDDPLALALFWIYSDGTDSVKNARSILTKAGAAGHDVERHELMLDLISKSIIEKEAESLLEQAGLQLKSGKWQPCEVALEQLIEKYVDSSFVQENVEQIRDCYARSEVLRLNAQTSRKDPTLRHRTDKGNDEGQTEEVNSTKRALQIPTSESHMRELSSSLNQGLVLWLRADKGIVKEKEERLSHWKDWSGYGNHASQAGVHKTPAFAIDDKSNKPTVKFNSANEFLSVGASDSLETLMNLTISIWVKPDRPHDTFFIVRGSKTERAWQLSFSRDQRVGFAAWSTPRISLKSKRQLVRGKWHRVTAVFDSTDCKIYINGDLDSSTGKGGILNDQQSTPIVLGKLEQDNGEFFDGSHREFRVYNRALTDEEIQALASAED